MSDFLESELQRALRPEDPGDDFTRKVMARVRSQTAAPQPRRAPLGHRVVQWLPAALAASLLAAIIVKHERIEERTVQDGLRAREQLLQALRVTSEKLDLAYEVVRDDTTESRPDDAGA
jgi:hypothetical protein